MHFFLYEIVARVVCIYLAFDCIRTLRNGFATGKIDTFNPNWISWHYPKDVKRDVRPIWFWSEVVTQTVILACCLCVIVFGWYQPGH